MAPADRALTLNLTLTLILTFIYCWSYYWGAVLQFHTLEVVALDGNAMLYNHKTTALYLLFFLLLLDFQWHDILIGAKPETSCRVGDKKGGRSGSWEVLQTYPHDPSAFTQVYLW